MKSTKLGTRVLAGLIAVVVSGLVVMGIDGLASYCGGATAGSNSAIAKSPPAMHKGTTMWKKT